MAQAAYHGTAMEQFLVAVDARMEQIYWAVYAVNQTGLCAINWYRNKFAAPEEVTIPDK